MTPDSDPDYWTKWARAFAYNYFNQPEVLRERVPQAAHIQLSGGGATLPRRRAT